MRAVIGGWTVASPHGAAKFSAGLARTRRDRVLFSSPTGMRDRTPRAFSVPETLLKRISGKKILRVRASVRPS